MKHFILAISMLLAFTAQAQKIYYDQMPKMPNVPVGKIVGASVAGVGGILAFGGLLDQSSGGGSSFNTPSESEHNTAHAVMITGIVMTVGGLICLFASPGHPKKKYVLQLVAPKRNEIGFAYSF